MKGRFWPLAASLWIFGCTSIRTLHVVPWSVPKPVGGLPRMAHCQQNTLPRYRCFIVVASPDLAEKPAP